MFIDLNKNNGKNYLRLVNAVRVTNKDGYNAHLLICMISLMMLGIIQKSLIRSIFTGKNGDHEGSVLTSQVANLGYNRFN